MNGFTYYAPTKIFFGRDCVKMCGQAAKEFGATRVLIHYGGQTCVKNGLLCAVEKYVSEQGLFYITLGGARPNPVRYSRFPKRSASAAIAPSDRRHSSARICLSSIAITSSSIETPFVGRILHGYKNNITTGCILPPQRGNTSLRKG